MEPILIKGGRVIDPTQSVDKISDVLIVDGAIRGIGQNLAAPEGAIVIDAKGLVVCPGFVDLHCHLREPGFEYKETIATGTLAAARGGFTTVCAMPNTNPPMDTRSTIDYVLAKAREEGHVRVLPIGCVTKGSLGKELAEMGELAEAGAIGFSDDGHPVYDTNIMRQALSYASGFGLPIINHCEEPGLFKGGAMNEGWVANRLGIKGIPNSAEEVMVSRDISLAELTGGRYHAAHLSTAGSLNLVRDAKAKGLNVTCEVTPHHLTLTDVVILGSEQPYSSESAFDALSPRSYDTFGKVNPPLRAKNDVSAMIEGLKDGTIDFIATDHAPHSRVDKECTFQDAAFGISVIETALGQVMSLVHAGKIELPLLIEKLTASPAKFLRRDDLGTLKEGMPADVTVFDPYAEWVVDPDKFASKGKNTPLRGRKLKGQIVATIVGGEVRHRA